jgi:GrpB-like predicted nucleotidyltransferase (UPF0157 family)
MALKSEIREYDPQWSTMFEAEEDLIRARLGDMVVTVHHVGSTAIPGLKAKPEIDLLIVVRSISEIDAVNLEMAELGYDVRGECGIEGRHYYSKDTNSRRTHKAHVCEAQHRNVGRQLAFRDYLRDHPEDAREYEALKTRLAEANTDGIAQYLDGKRPYIEIIIQKALDEGYGRQDT